MTRPGDTALHVIPRLLKILATDMVRLINPAFDAA
jgi:hypothetical protein